MRPPRALRARGACLGLGGGPVLLRHVSSQCAPVGVVCDSEAVHVICVCIELAPETLCVRLGRGLYCLQAKTCRQRNVCEGQCGGCLTSLSEKLWVAGDVKLQVVRTCAVRMNGSVCVLDVRTEPELLMISTLE